MNYGNNKKIETTMPVKANTELLANELTEGASSGFVDPLEFLVKIEFLTKVLEQAKSKLKNWHCKT